MNRKKIWIVVAIISVVLGIVLGLKFYHREVGPWEEVRIWTATPGGTYCPLGEGLALILEQLSGTPITKANAIESSGSIANIDTLIEPGKNRDIAFTMASDLVRRDSSEQGKLRILARLYRDVLQIAVRKNARIKKIADLKGRNVSVGPKGSGTEMITRRILETVGGLDPNDYTAYNAPSFDQAAKMLRNGDLHAAFLMAGTPTAAIDSALDSVGVSDPNGFELLSLDADTLSSLRQLHPELGTREHTIPANLYPNQPDDVNTLASDVFLICRKDLPEDLASMILDALFDNIEDLLLVHAKAQDIRPTKEAFELPEDFPFRLHSGAKNFLAEEREKLLIATGALNGKYYRLGKTIEDLLEAWYISARAIQTDGSLENAVRLANARPTIAIMQYDAALACFGKSEFVYKKFKHTADWPDANMPEMRNIRRIARLHEERVHVIVNRDRLRAIGGSKLTGTEKATGATQDSERGGPENVADPTHSENDAGNNTTQEITDLDTLLGVLSQKGDPITVCPGPKRSATQLVARSILEHHIETYATPGKSLTLITPRFLSVREMASQLENGKIDMGFFVSSTPTLAMRKLLHGDKVRLLSLGRKEREQMTGAFFKAARIDPNMYGCQRGYGPIETLATQAVLVTTGDLPLEDVRIITKAIFENLPYLNITDLTKENMAAIELDSPPLHAGAEEYYRDAGLLLIEPSLLYDLRVTWTILGCLTMLVTVLCLPACTGLLVLRRNRTANEIGRRILAIPLEATIQDSVRRFIKIRDEIQDRVRRRWWRFGELDKLRWRYLRDLVHDRIGEAKENLTRTFVMEIRTVMTDTELSDAERQQRCRSIEIRVLELFAKGELDPSQQKILRELTRECREHDPEAGELDNERK
jgi:TRAP transporter TAXI family solute receptor